MSDNSAPKTVAQNEPQSVMNFIIDFHGLERALEHVVIACKNRAGKALEEWDDSDQAERFLAAAKKIDELRLRSRFVRGL